MTVSRADSLDFLQDSPEACRFPGQLNRCRVWIFFAGVACEIPAIVLRPLHDLSLDRIVVIVIDGCSDLFVSQFGRTHEAGFEKRPPSSPGFIPFPCKQMRVLLYKLGKGGPVRNDDRVMCMICHGAKGKDRNSIASGDSAVNGEEYQIIIEGIEDDYTADRLLAYMVNLSRIDSPFFHAFQASR